MTRNDRAVGVAGLVACLALVAIAGLALPAGAQDGGATEIDRCRNITEPGSYELTADITDSGAERCIWIQSSNVSVDGQGHTIDGVDGADTIGIEIREPTKVSESAEELSNVDVTDAVVTDWAKGLSYSVVTEGSVTDLRIADNDEGIDLEDASQFAVAGNTITANEGSGITDFGANAEIADNEITDNGGSGIALSGGSYDIRNNTVNDNAGNGISLLASFADAGTITNNTASGNGFDGIDVADSLPDRIADNTANDNGRAGISLDETFGLELTGNTVNDNARGIDLTLTDNTTVEDTVARGNTEWAFYSGGTSAFPPAEPSTVRNLTTGSATVSFEELGVALTGVDAPPTDPDGRTNVGAYVNTTSTREDREQRNGTFLALDVSYTDAAVADAGLDENSLRLLRFDDGTWSRVEESNRVDTGANEVRANVTSFGGPTVLAPLGYAPPGDVTGDGEPPGDPDADGLYEDVNGDGTFDVVDVQAVFANRRSIERRDDDPAFDFNEDGNFDIVDVQALFVEEQAADAGTS